MRNAIVSVDEFNNDMVSSTAKNDGVCKIQKSSSSDEDEDEFNDMLADLKGESDHDSEDSE